jgi:hypothetical protein
MDVKYIDPHVAAGAMVGRRRSIGVGLLAALAYAVSACGGNAVSSDRVDHAVALMTGKDQPACKILLDYQDGNGSFRCGGYFCWVTGHAKQHGYGPVIEGAAYYDCDDRYTYREGMRYMKWERCVVEHDEKMRVLTEPECHAAAWMEGSSIGGF